jgi:hypothetical protein
MPHPIENVERPLALFLMAVALILLLFLGMRVWQARQREEGFRSTLRSYEQTLRPGMKRKEVEEYLRSKNIEFSGLAQGDITKIGQDVDAITLFCGKPDVFVQFQFFGPMQQQPQMGADAGDTLNKIEIIRRSSGCI